MLFSLLLVIPLFQPPVSWQVVEPKTPEVQIIFVGEGSSQFRPSINLIVEDVDISQKNYVKAAKALHLKEPNTKWRDLGSLKTKAGEGKLTEISFESPAGEIKMLQSILVKDKKAYILTASTLKKDFLGIRKEFISSMQSLMLSDDLIEAVADESKRLRLQSFFAELKNDSLDENPTISKQKKLNLLQEEIVNGCTEMGNYWQFLALKEGIAIISD